MRVLIVDDHAMFRRGLREILVDEFDDLEFSEATNAEEALDLLRSGEWDVVILDVSMPGRSGLDALKEIKRDRPTLPVLMLSFHSEEHFATRVLKAGASGYMTKTSAPEELVNAIKKILVGGKYVSPELAEQLAEDLERDAVGTLPHKRLSDREYEVLLDIARGETVSEIGDKLSLSVKTISTYRARILEKMNLRSNADLVRYAIRHGLVEDDVD